jgi:tRNA G18 (ribose-2'-O)-methylase SpoU
MLAQLDRSYSPYLGKSSENMNHPLVVSESMVHVFNYWHEGIQKGIRCGNELYAFLQSFPLHDRMKAYEIAYEKVEQGVMACITVSKTHYSIWLSLRSQNHTRNDIPIT